MKPALILNVEAALGVDLKRVCMEMQHVSDALFIEVRCKANGCLLYARPRGSWMRLYEGIADAGKRNPKFPVSHSYSSGD